MSKKQIRLTKSKISLIVSLILLAISIYKGKDYLNQGSSKTKESTASVQSKLNDSNEKFYDVIKVVDGDTLVINMEGKEEKLRLIGINTPETVDPRKEVECFGKEATSKAKSILQGKKVRIEFDSTQDRRDKYGRLLSYVFLEDGTNFNEMMIGEGYAYEYTYETPYKYQKTFKAVQKDAQEKRRGLWGGCKI